MQCPLLCRIWCTESKSISRESEETRYRNNPNPNILDLHIIVIHNSYYRTPDSESALFDYSFRSSDLVLSRWEPWHIRLLTRILESMALSIKWVEVREEERWSEVEIRGEEWMKDQWIMDVIFVSRCVVYSEATMLTGSYQCSFLISSFSLPMLNPTECPCSSSWLSCAWLHCVCRSREKW